MINFEEELKKFKPSLEVDDVEESIVKDEIQDMLDVLQAMMKQMDNTKSGNVE